MSKSDDVTQAGAESLVDEIEALINERVAAATAPLIVRIEELERQVAELRGQRVARG